MLNRSAHTLRYRRFASILTDANARLAVEVVVSLLPPVGLSPTTLRQLAWRTDSCRYLFVQQLGDSMVDVFGSVVSMKAIDFKRK